MPDTDLPGSPKRDALRAVPRRGLTAFAKIAPVLFGAIALRGLVLGYGGVSTLTAVGVLAGPLLIGCFIWALVTASTSDGFAGLAGWVAGGAVVAILASLALGLFLPLDEGDRAVGAMWEFWAFVAVAGAITGGAYWAMAQGVGSSLPR